MSVHKKASENGIAKKRNEDCNLSIPQGGYHDSGIPRRVYDAELLLTKVELSICRKKTKHVDVNLCHHSDAWTRAKEIQSSLPTKFPSEMRIMLPSYVSGCFWLQLGKKFWNLHLPQENVEMTLEDENNEEYRAEYVWKEAGLSGGWKGFSVAHMLAEGDALIFQLMRPTKFKVYIVRANGFHEVDGAAGLSKPDLCSKGVDSDELTNGEELKASEVKDNNHGHEDCFPKEISMKNTSQDNHEKCDASTEHVLHMLEHLPDDLVPEAPGGIRFSKSKVDFKKGKSIVDFSIVINGLVIDSELSKQVRLRYYELCCSQQSFLHDRLLEGLNYKLAAGIVSETVNIADAIRASKITTFTKNLFGWGQTLKALEDVGMNVGFIRARVDKLVKFAVKLKSYREGRCGHTNSINQLFEAKEAARIGDELEKDRGKLEMEFQEVLNAPW